MSQSLSVVVVQADANERAQLRAALGTSAAIQIVGERPDVRGGLALARQVRPDLLVLELAAPVEDTLAAAAQYHMEQPEVCMILTTDRFDPDTLLRAMRTGAQDVLRRPLDRSALGAAVERVASLKARKHGGPAGRMVITVFSNKGGLGCSTIAANLALTMRDLSGREVALADLDHQSGDIAFLMGLNPHRSIADVMSAARLDSATVQDALEKHPSGVRVLPQPEQLERAEGIEPGFAGSVLEVLGAMFDYVVVDAPHGFNDLTLEIFDRSSVILLVTELSLSSARAARRALDVFHRLNYLATPDRVRPLVNRYVENGPILLAQFEETLGLPVAAKIANDYTAVSTAINLARPLCEDSPESPASRDLMALARRLTGVEADVQASSVAKAQRRGLFWPFRRRKAA